MAKGKGGNRNSVAGSSTRKAKVNTDNTYGFNLGKVSDKVAVTMGKPSNKNSAQALKRKVRG